MDDVKLIIENCEINAFSTNAEAMVTYSVVSSSGPTNPNILIAAMRNVPSIGSIKDFANVPGGPTIGFSDGVPSAKGLFSHQMRVWRITPRIIGQNSQTMFIDVYYKSRPHASIQAGASGTQTRTETYLADSSGTRKQMTLDWLAKAGVWGSVGGVQIPPTDTQFPLTPVTSTRLQFGSTIRMSATYYTDEITYSQLLALQNSMTTTINLLPFLTNVGYDDSRMWVCSNFDIQTSDQFEYRVSAEFVFSPYGWDSINVFTTPQLYGNQLAIVSDTALNKVIAGKTSLQSVPAPIRDSLAGIGRFPQNFGTDFGPLLQFLYQPSGISYIQLAQNLFASSV